MSDRTSTDELAVDVTRALEEVTVPAYVLDREGRFRWLNRGALELIGDAVGQPLSRVVVREHVNRARTEFARKLLGEAGSDEYDLAFTTVDGRRTTVRISSVPLWEDGRIVGVFGVAYPSWTDIAAPECTNARSAHAPALTARQYETLALLADGLGTDAIAQRLGVAAETARNHIRGLRRELGVHTRLEAVVRGYRIGLLTPRRD